VTVINNTLIIQPYLYNIVLYSEPPPKVKNTTCQKCTHKKQIRDVVSDIDHRVFNEIINRKKINNITPRQT